MSILIESRLDEPFSLGSGRTIRPPAGWSAEGFVSGSDQLRLRPASHVRWCPPGCERLSLHWNKSTTPLANAAAEHFSELLRSPLGVVRVEDLAPLFPAMIRIPLLRITRAQVTHLPRYGPFLEIDYFIAEQGEAGIVYYAPTDRFEHGEYQLLAYEGREPAYTTFLAVARKSLRTFCESNDFSVPPRRTGVVRKKTSNLKKTIPRKKTLGVTTSMPGGLVFEYKLQAGDTVKAIVMKHWPGLSEEEVRRRVKEIYSINRARGNALFAWTLSEGDSLLLPMQQVFDEI